MKKEGMHQLRKDLVLTVSLKLIGLEEKILRPTTPTVETESIELVPQISEKELIPERVSDLTYYLKNKVFQMNAGCISNQISKWEKITSDPEILSTDTRLP